MPKVYVDIVRLQDIFELIDEELPGCLNPKDFIHFIEIVGV